MEKENSKYCDLITNKIYKIIEKKNIVNGVTLFPMLRVVNNKLFLGSLIEVQDEKLFNRNKVVRPKYWVLLDTKNYDLVEFNKTAEKDYMDNNIIPLDKEYNDVFKEEMKEVQKYTVDKTVKYRDFLMNDVKNELVKVQKNIIDAIDNKLIIDNKEVSATDYLYANVEDELNNKVKELVDLIVTNKYSTIVYYYQDLVEQIVEEYNEKNTINIKKMNLASTILDTYYGECYGIKYFFNNK